MQQRLTVAATLAFLLLCSYEPGQAGDEGRQIVVTPADLRWVDSPTRPGQQSAAILGDQLKPGPYIRRVRFPPNTVNPPHSHPDDRQVTIVSGTWYLGHGSTVHRDHVTKAVAGTFFTEPANNVHWEITGPDEVIVQVSGTGPTTTTYVK